MLIFFYKVKFEIYEILRGTHSVQIINIVKLISVITIY